MTAHKDVDMITAKANNMDLVVLVNDKNNGIWGIGGFESLISTGPTGEHFLCLPQHKEAVLHALNGGIVQITTDSNWNNPSILDRIGKWQNYSDAWYMSPYCQSRIKPKKEKRWIIAKPHSLASMMYFETEKQARDAIDRINKFEGSDRHGGQAIEIEIEV